MLQKIIIFVLFFMQLHFTSAQNINFNFGVKTGIGLGTSSTTSFLGVNTEIGSIQIPEDILIKQYEESFNNHMTLSAIIYFDINFNSWFAISPEVSLFTNNHEKIVGRISTLMQSDTQPYNISDWELITEKVKFLVVQADMLAKFRYHWLYMGIGPGLAVALPPKFDNEQFNNLYDRRTRLDFLGVFDVGINVPVGAHKKHFITISTRTDINISGMLRVKKANNHWQDREINGNNQSIYGLNAVRGTFYLGYMYQFA